MGLGSQSWRKLSQTFSWAWRSSVMARAFELVEPDFLGSVSFDEARGNVGDF
jgi:hypothetical protein